MIPQDLKQAFFPEGVPESFPPNPRFPSAPPPPPGAFKSHRRVTWRDIDAAQIVNNPVFLDYIEECGFQVVAAHGWPVERILLPQGEAAKRLGVDLWKLQAAIGRGQVVCSGRAGRYRVISETDLPRVAEALRTAGYLADGDLSTASA
jgi:hypothetical protein